MRCSTRRILFFFFFLWLLYLLCYVIREFMYHPPAQRKKILLQLHQPEPDHDFLKSHAVVEVWGKAAIGLYLWEHIFEGSLSRDSNFLVERDSLFIEGLHLKFSTGYHVTPKNVNRYVENVVLVINGRETDKVTDAMVWLDRICVSHYFKKLRNVGLVLLGSEQCDNSWLIGYISKCSLVLKFTFIVYDIPNANGKNIFQWPLGVATYRNFPVIPKILINIENERQFKCNFLGTVYPRSSREKLFNMLQSDAYNKLCYVKARFQWEPKETKESMLNYQKVLRESDLTLCPVGMNSEAYRIYEAMSYGSVPVIEDVMTPGKCGPVNTSHKFSAPFRLLKMYKAPVIFVKDWSELDKVFKKEKDLSMHDIVRRRQAVLDWYQKFKYDMREQFIETIKLNFV